MAQLGKSTQPSAEYADAVDPHLIARSTLGLSKISMSCMMRLRIRIFEPHAPLPAKDLELES